MRGLNSGRRWRLREVRQLCFPDRADETDAIGERSAAAMQSETAISGRCPPWRYKKALSTASVETTVLSVDPALASQTADFTMPTLAGKAVGPTGFGLMRASPRLQTGSKG